MIVADAGSAAAAHPPEGSAATRAAKGRLVAWARASDARRHQFWSGTGIVITGLGLATLSGVALARAVSSRSRAAGSAVAPGDRSSRLTRWTLAGRVLAWVIPSTLRLLTRSTLPPRLPLAAPSKEHP